jgi:beta-glucosidase
MQEIQTVEPFELPSGFLLGTATASLQIEGGDTNNSWYRWSESGHIRDGSHCRVACDHWNRVDEDVRLMTAIGANAYRMSLEWSRIEPEEGRFESAALEHYRREVEQLIASGIRPMITLHHFSNPLWFEDDGAWMNSEAPARFLRYVRKVLAVLGDQVADWITINEPNVYLIMGYVFGDWPPGETDVGSVFRGARIMSRAHALAYLAIHEEREAAGYSDTRVGVAHHLRVYDPAGGPLDRLSTGILKRLSQDIFVEAMTTGKSKFPVGRLDLPSQRGANGLLSDFLGINYYSRDTVRFSLKPSDGFAVRSTPDGAPVNDLGWEIYPAGLYRVIRQYWQRYRLPVMITENGTCDAVDRLRPRYLADHLAQVVRAQNEGIPVPAYFHWSLMDNFEWIEGTSARFGLYEVDFQTQKRTMRESGRLFAEIADSGSLTGEMIDRFDLRRAYSD